MKDVQALEKASNATDLHLLDQAKTLGLVTDEQYDKLGHLRGMRNRYAHPTGRGPTEQEALAALEIAVDTVLSQPTLLRHGYADYQLAALFGELHWLPDDEQVVRENAASVAQRLHPVAAPHLLEGLVEGYEQVFGDPERGPIRRRAGWFTVGFLAEAQPDFSKPGWRIVDLIRRHPNAASLMFGTPETFVLLPEQAQGVVLGHLTQPMAGSMPSAARLLGLRRTRELAEAGLLSPDQLEMFDITIDKAPYRTLQNAGVPLEAYADRLLDDLRAHTWGIQNPAAVALANAGPDQVQELSEEEQEQLGRNILQAAEGSAHRAQELIERIRTSSRTWPEAFVRGLLFEALMDDEHRFRLKPAHLLDVLVIALSHRLGGGLVGEATRLIRESKPKRGVDDHLPGQGWVNQYDVAVEILESAKESGSDKDALIDSLIQAVRSAKPPEDAEE